MSVGNYPPAGDMTAVNREAELDYRANEKETNMRPFCTGCKKHADEIEEYIEIAKEESMTPDDYVRKEEGTYNRANGHFLCTKCYVKAGMPSSPRGWTAP